MNCHNAAREYAGARRLRRQAAQLTNDMLMEKFECTGWALNRTLRCRPCHLPEEDQRLIRQCAAERDRLKRKAEGTTMVGVCRRYKIDREKLITALIEIGEWEVAA